MAELSRSLIFIGFMGSGKTSAARIAATELGVTPIDTDALLEEAIGMKIETFFDQHGEAAFREREGEIVGELLEHSDGDVIALGGGSVLSERVSRALTDHVVVLLDVDAQAAWRRAAGKGRPLARNRPKFTELYEQRRGIYYQLADAIIPHGGRNMVRRAIASLVDLRGAPVGTRMLWAATLSGDYPVYVGRGLLRSGFWPIGGGRFCVTDGNVAELYLELLGDPKAKIVVPPGESNKTVAVAEHVWRELAQAGMSRDDHVIALGGGVVGDLAGFCAATYQRGVRVVQVPTTLVAQVDSAYGGKTGVDLPEAKNYVGAYHQPAAVMVDPTTLESLPEEERAAGYAEVLKTALIAGGELWQSVASGGPVTDEVILSCAQTKTAVVAEDEHDSGRRQVLNLGHTVGHAIETVTGYERYRHGEAVALGLLATLRLSGQEELRQRVVELLRAVGLPTQMSDVDADSVVAATARDKKRRGGRVPFVLVDAPGQVRFGAEVSDSDLLVAVKGLSDGR